MQVVGYREEHSAEFFERHGGKVWPPLADKGGNLLFEDGAVASANLSRREEPPTDVLALLHRRRNYHQGRHDLFVRAFEQLKAALIDPRNTFAWPQDGSLGDCPSLDGETVLRHIRFFVNKHKEALAKIDQEIFDLPSSVQERERQAAYERTMQEHQANEVSRQQRIASINL